MGVFPDRTGVKLSGSRPALRLFPPMIQGRDPNIKGGLTNIISGGTPDRVSGASPVNQAIHWLGLLSASALPPLIIVARRFQKPPWVNINDDPETCSLN